MSSANLLKTLGIGAGTLGGGAALHGLGLGDVLSPLDFPRQALYNTFAAPARAIESGNWSDLLGAVPGVAGGILGGVVGGPMGVLAGSTLGGALQGIGNASGAQAFNAPSVRDLTGTDDFLPNLAVGLATDPLMYAGGAGTWRAGKAALGAEKAAPLVKAAAEVAPIAKAAEEIVPVAKLAEEVPMASRASIPVPKIKPSIEIPVAVPSIPTAERVAEPFYSRLENAINGLPNSVKSESAINMLKKSGVATEEIEATGLREMLEARKGQKVTKDELLKHFGENKIQIEEAWKGGFSEPISTTGFNYEEAAARFEELRVKPNLTAAESAEFRRLGNHLDDFQANEFGVTERPSYHDARFAENVNPGGENYRELLLKLPEKKGVAPYQSSHWPDDPNTVAHVRFNDRVGPKGEKILHIEEIQSDWHQAGKKAGYGDGESARAALDQQREAILDKWRQSKNPTERMALHDEIRGLTDKLENMPDKVPDAPFKDTWHELAMKRMIRYAADHDYKAITLNSGEAIQAVTGGELSGQRAFYGSPGNAETVAAYKAMGPETGYTNVEQIIKNNTPIEGMVPGWMRKYGKKYGVEIESVGTPSEKATADAVTSLRLKHEKLLQEKAAALEARDYPDADRIRSQLDSVWRETSGVLSWHAKTAVAAASGIHANVHAAETSPAGVSRSAASECWSAARRCWHRWPFASRLAHGEARMTTPEIQAKIADIKNIAKFKSASNSGNPRYLAEIEAMLDSIGDGYFLRITPINENLFGIAQLLLAECKRLKGV